MALIRSVRGFTPVYGVNCFFAETAAIIGDVIMGDECSVWYNTVLRGDVNSIRIGNRVNIQDGSVLHTLFEKSVIEIGNNVSIGHNVIIHGAQLSDNVLVGMGSIVMDHVKVGENSIIAAGAVVLDSTIIEPGSIYGGVPAKRLKGVDEEQTREMIEKIARNYVFYAGWYKEERK
jgi:carbonic anhydrase/acetyltransferase-like protein (isoleucine patch superfamily)